LKCADGGFKGHPQEIPRMFVTRYYKKIIKGKHITYVLTEYPQFETQYEYAIIKRFSFIDAFIPTVYDIKYLIRYTDKNFYDNIEIIGNSIQEFHCKVLFKGVGVGVNIIPNERGDLKRDKEMK
jgi:hypothetical protein